MTDHQDLELVQPEKVHLPLWKEDDLSERDEFVGYPITLKRMLLYCACSWFIFGLGPLFLAIWFYKHFRTFIKSGSQGSVTTVVLIWFSSLSFFKLCKVYQERAANRNEEFKVHLYDAPLVFLLSTAFASNLVQLLVPLLGAKYIVLLFIAPAISLLPLMYFQYRVNQLNRRLLPDKDFAPPITRLQWALLTLGLLSSIAIASTIFL